LLVIVVGDITNATYIHTYIHIHKYIPAIRSGCLHANASCPMKVVLLRETEVDPINHSSARVVVQ
jgi:hypothetical protein